MRQVPLALWRAAAILLLCAATLAAFSEPFRFAPVGTARLLLLDSKGWIDSRAGVRRLAGPPNTIELTPAEGHPFSFALTRFRAAEGVRHLRITAELRPVGVVAGRQDWQRARILLWSYDASGRRLTYLPHDVATEDGTGDWRRHGLIVPVPPQTRSFGLILAHAGIGGAMRVRDLGLEIVAETASFKAVRLLLVALWLGVGAWAVAPLVRRALHPMRALALLCGAAILAAALAPQPHFSEMTHAAASAALDGVRAAERTVRGAFVARPPAPARRRAAAPPADAGPRVPAAPRAAAPEGTPEASARTTSSLKDIALSHGLGLPEVTHFLGFLALGLVVALGHAATPVPLLLAAGSVFAAASETLQSFELTRTPEFGDLAVDLGGLACGIGPILALRGLRLLRRRRRAARA